MFKVLPLVAPSILFAVFLSFRDIRQKLFFRKRLRLRTHGTNPIFLRLIQLSKTTSRQSSGRKKQRELLRAHGFLAETLLRNDFFYLFLLAVFPKNISILSHRVPIFTAVRNPADLMIGETF